MEWPNFSCIGESREVRGKVSEKKKLSSIFITLLEYLMTRFGHRVRCLRQCPVHVMWLAAHCLKISFSSCAGKPIAGEQSALVFVVRKESEWGALSDWPFTGPYKVAEDWALRFRLAAPRCSCWEADQRSREKSISAGTKHPLLALGFWLVRMVELTRWFPYSPMF